MKVIFAILFLSIYVSGFTQQVDRSKKKIVLLDRYYNSERKPDSSGKLYYWHYTWEASSNPGFSMLGDLFKEYKFELKSIDNAPTKSNLKSAAVYIIVDPDNIADNPTPNYINEADSKTISNWVKAGGTLILMANDRINCDLKHFNILAGKFGIQFLDPGVNMVKNDQFETGSVIANDPELFNTPVKLFLKDISPLDVKFPAKAIVKKGTDNIFAIARHGKGKVIAVGDPWIYNEYIDHRRLPKEYENLKGARQMIEWVCECRLPEP